MSAIAEVGPEAIESRTIRKVKARIIPFVLILFVVNALDRNNIGFGSFALFISAGHHYIP